MQGPVTLQQRLPYKRSFKTRLGSSLYPDDIISSHKVNFVSGCFTHCSGTPACIGFNYRAKESLNDNENCQLVSKTSIMKGNKPGNWTFYHDAKIKVYTVNISAGQGCFTLKFG